MQIEQASYLLGARRDGLDVSCSFLAGIVTM